MGAPDTDTDKRDEPAAFALMAAVAAAMLVANSPLGANYQQLLAFDLTLGLAPLALTKSELAPCARCFPAHGYRLHHEPVSESAGLSR